MNELHLVPPKKKVWGIEKGYYLEIVTFTFLIKEIERVFSQQR